MPTLNFQTERPPWPEDMQEALTAQEERLREMALNAKGKRAKEARRTRIIRWAMRLTIIAITLWLLCETVIS